MATLPDERQPEQQAIELCTAPWLAAPGPYRTAARRRQQHDQPEELGDGKRDAGQQAGGQRQRRTHRVVEARELRYDPHQDVVTTMPDNARRMAG